LISSQITKISLDREQFDISSIKQSEDYKSLNDKAHQIIDFIISQQDVFKVDTESQTAEIRNMHVETNEMIIEQHDVTRIEIIEAIQVTEQHNEADQLATRQEIAQLKEAIKQLSEQMKQKDIELGEFLKAFRETRSQKKKVLQKRSNAVSATLLALEIMYRSLQGSQEC
jgi:hypothetical protein